MLPKMTNRVDGCRGIAFVPVLGPASAYNPFWGSPHPGKSLFVTRKASFNTIILLHISQHHNNEWVRPASDNFSAASTHRTRWTTVLRCAAINSVWVCVNIHLLPGPFLYAGSIFIDLLQGCSTTYNRSRSCFVGLIVQYFLGQSE